MEAEKTAAPKRTRRRRANAPGGRRKQHFVRVTPEEDEKLSCLAEQAGVSVPRLLIESTLTRPTDPSSMEQQAIIDELYGLRRQITGIAVNVNQIAHATNATLERQAGETAALAATMSTLDEIRQALDRVGRR